MTRSSTAHSRTNSGTPFGAQLDTHGSLAALDGARHRRLALTAPVGEVDQDDVADLQALYDELDGHRSMLGYADFRRERTTMATAARIAPKFTDEQISEVLSLIKGADSVELKLTVPAENRTQGATALGVDPLDAEIRQVFFFDTPDLTLNKAGVVVRARRVQRKGDDTVVKLRPVVPQELPAALRASPNFGVEVDAMPGGFVCSGSMKRALGTPDAKGKGTMNVRDTLLGGIRSASCSRRNSARSTPSTRPTESSSTISRCSGPIFVLKLKFAPKGYDRKLVAELWLYPDNSMILELSTKCPPAETFNVGRRDAGVPERARHRPLRRAGDEDEEGARVLRRAAAGRKRPKGCGKPRSGCAIGVESPGFVSESSALAGEEVWKWFLPTTTRSWTSWERCSSSSRG